MELAHSAFISLCFGFVFGAVKAYSKKVFFFFLTALVIFFIVIYTMATAYNTAMPPFDWRRTLVGIVTFNTGMFSGELAYERAFGDRR